MAGDRAAVMLRVNGEDRAVLASPADTLLAVLRDECGLTGAKRGCDQGVCGACTVLVEGRAVRACLSLAVNTQGQEITTVEGLAGDGPMTPLQRALVEGGALQCGFCSPGMIVTLSALLTSNTKPGREEIRHAIAGNICRCTGYAKIVDAVAELGEGAA